MTFDDLHSNNDNSNNNNNNNNNNVTLVHVTRQYDDVMCTVDVESGEKEKMSSSSSSH